jgi:hypothetical protein
MTAIPPWIWLFWPFIQQFEWSFLFGFGIAVFCIRRPLRFLYPLRQAFNQFARNRGWAVFAVIVLAICARLALQPLLGTPRPGIHDEFGYLLTADTFAHGRLSNPTPAMWTHFETIHQFFIPTYQSQFPIGYPVVLAAAWVLTGQPWIGVLITTACLCGALVWMLQAFVPPRWALWAGLFAIARVALFGYWINSFWGGSLAALGGCLFLGALGRLVPGIGRPNVARQSYPTIDAILGACGLAAMATTRPLEGFAFALPGVTLLLWSWLKDSATRRERFGRVFLPSLLVLVAVFAFMLIYQKAVTGNYLESPYSVAFRQYHIGKPFFFQDLRIPPEYRHLEFRYIYIYFEAGYIEGMRSWGGFFSSQLARFQYYWEFYIGPLMTAPLLFALCVVWKKRWTLVLVSLGAVTAVVSIESWIQTHYVAPVFGAGVLILTLGVRRLRMVRIAGFPWGRLFVGTLPLLCILMVGVRVAVYPKPSAADNLLWPPGWAFSTPRLPQRELIEDQLNRLPGDHLIIVRYRAIFHSPHEEFVFNEADLEHAHLLWARSMTAKQNCILVLYFPDRDYWVVDHWGDVVVKRKETAEEICNAKNPMYEPNHPMIYYTMGAFRAPAQSGGDERHSNTE